jgi:hypothetical protein
VTAELRRALARLEPNDPARPLVELVIEEDDPALTAAVVRRLLLEIRAEKGGPRAEPAADRETTRVATGDLRE